MLVQQCIGAGGLEPQGQRPADFILKRKIYVIDTETALVSCSLVYFLWTVFFFIR